MCVFLGVFNLKTAHKHNAEAFNHLVSQTQSSIQKRFSLYETSLKGGLGLYNASNAVSRVEWKDYVETLHIDKTLPGINGLGFIEYVPKDNLMNFLENTREDYPEFQNYPNTDFKDKFIIKYIVPEKDNLKAIGLDIGFEENRREAAEKSRDSGLPKLTKKITLVQDDEKLAGFLLLVPFYENATAPKTLVEKRKNIIGWVYAPFISKNFLKKLDYANSKYLSFGVYDGQYITSKNLIYQTPNKPKENGFSKITRIIVAGNTWTIKWQESEIHNPVVKTRVYYYIIILGLIASIFTYFLLAVVMRQKRKIQTLVDKKTSQLSESQKFLYLIMNTIPDRVFVKDRNFRIVRANEAFMSLYPPEKRDKVIGYTTVESFPKEEADKFLEQDRIAFENGVSQVQENITSHTGEQLNLLTTKVKFYDHHNDEYILGISRDVTDLIQIQKNLEQKVEERTKEYKEQKILAEKAGDAKEEFLANMSHELRTPLNSIIGLTNIITSDGDLNKEQSEMLNIIQKASDNLLQTVNDILDISKIESGHIELESKTFNLSGLLYSIIDQCKPLASQKGLLVHHNLPELDNVFIKGDEHRIMRVINNLTSNAIKYTDEGQIDIQFGTFDKDGVTVELVCSVADTGIGIPEDKLDKIFDKFTQAKESTERLYGGTGLGLSITKELVTLMGGEISVKSEIGKGSVFTVKLPFQKSDESEEETYVEKYEDAVNEELTEDYERVSIQDAKILVAEDHEFNKIFIAKLLNRLGNDNYTIVENGALALNACKEEDYDLILMDCNMPVMNGYEASRKIREYEDQQDKVKRVPISAMTADVMPGTRERCLSAGMNEYITKPLEENLFRSVMRKWLIFDGQNDGKSSAGDESKSTVHINLSLLDEYTDNDEKAKAELIKIFYENSVEDLERLKNNCSNYNKKIWVEAAHRLKGSSSYIGATSLKNLCTVAETAKLKNEADRQDIYLKIKQEHKTICQILKQKKLL